MQHFNPIQSKWVVPSPMRRVSLLQQSIPFGVAILYTLEKILQFVALKARKTLSLHTIFLKQNANKASHCFDFYLSIVFLVKGLDTSIQL